jgi:adenylylsulfate kinase
MQQAFAVWLTGLPASGKSTIARALLGSLHGRGVAAAVLESDVMRTQITPFARYAEDERERFYRTFAEIGILLVKMGTPVLLDATANKRAHRVQARERIERFAEVFVDTSLEVCAARDPKGLYRAAREGRASSLPGPQAAYEPPLRPELVVSGAKTGADEAAQAIIALLEARGWI